MKLINQKNYLETHYGFGKNKTDKIPDIIGYGHIHTPNIFRIGNKMIFNPGSIGMPSEMKNTDEIKPENKFSCLTSYIILEGEYQKEELDSLSIQLVRLPYNVQEEIKRLENTDMSTNIMTKKELIRKLQTAEP